MQIFRGTLPAGCRVHRGDEIAGITNYAPDILLGCIILLTFFACRYVTSHPQYADSAAYAGRFRQLQSRAVSTIRTKCHQILRHAADQVLLALLHWLTTSNPFMLQCILQKGSKCQSRLNVNCLANEHCCEHALACQLTYVTHALCKQHVKSMSKHTSFAAQVQAAVREQLSARHSSQTNGTANGKQQPQAALPEGARTTLLYIRFRAAAEPGLKGKLRPELWQCM